MMKMEIKLQIDLVDYKLIHDKPSEQPIFQKVITKLPNPNSILSANTKDEYGIEININIEQLLQRIKIKVQHLNGQQ